MPAALRPLLFLLLTAPAAFAQGIQLNGDFETGHLDGWSFDGLHHTVNTNNPPGAWQWLCFRAHGVRGATPSFRTNTTSTGDVYRDYHRMVWRPLGERAWRFFEIGEKPGDGWYWFRNAAPFQHDAVEIAYWQSYGTTQLRAAGAALASLGSPWVQDKAVIGRSFEGRSLAALTITDPAVPAAQKQSVVLIARQHGCESLGNLALEGMLAFALSADPAAAALRRKALLHVYAMANPDAAANGWTREGRHRSGLAWVDFNRDWRTGSAMLGGAPSDSFEIDALRDDILLRSGGRAAFLIDIHSHPKGSQGLGWYWWYRGDAQRADAFFQSVWDHDRAAHQGETVYSWPTHPPGPGSTTAMDWGGPVGQTVGTLDGLGLTLEPIAAPFGRNRDTARIRAAGEAVMRALEAHL